MAITFQILDALSAPEFEDRGGKWTPHVHWIVPTHDEVEAKFIQELLDKHSKNVEAYFIAPTLDGQTYTIELQFQDHANAKACQKEYMQGFCKGGSVSKAKKAKKKVARKRLYKDRMYQLPDGEFFWYYAVWDHHGNLIGKVYDAIDGCLANKILHRSVLEEAVLIPKGEEPWILE